MTICDLWWVLVLLIWCLKRLNHWHFSAWYSSWVRGRGQVGSLVHWIGAQRFRRFRFPHRLGRWKMRKWRSWNPLEPVTAGDMVFEMWGVQLSDIMILKILTSTKHFGSCLMILMITDCLFCRVEGLVFGVQVRWGITPQIAGEMSALGYERSPWRPEVFGHHPVKHPVSLGCPILGILDITL